MAQWRGLGSVRRAAALALIAASGAVASAQAETLTSVGSDTLRPLMEAWAEGYGGMAPDTSIDIASPGSNAAPAALSEGRSDLAPMSRKMTDGEIDGFKAVRGRRPLKLVVALDALAVYVHQDNPIGGATLAQIDRVFSKERRCAGGKAYETWRPFVYGEFSTRAIELHSRTPQSGTYTTFIELALCGGPLADGVVFHEDSADLVAAIAAEPSAIGFAGIGYDRPGVKTVAIAENDDEPYVPAIPDRLAASDDPAERYKNVVSGKYPLSRDLHIYIDPDEVETVRGFLDFVLSTDGQALAAEVGFVPLPPASLDEERRKLDPDYRPKWWRLEKPDWWPFG
ncbi:MAG: phosphate ABC transporter substrate-binding protein [Pseudomonadota bacterium]